MKRFMRKISAVLVATLLFMTVAPNLAYASDDIDFASQSEAVTESAPSEDSAPASEPAPAEESAPETETAPATESEPETEPAPVIESAPETETEPATETEPEAGITPAEENAPETASAPATERVPETDPAPVIESASETELAPAVGGLTEPNPASVGGEESVSTSEDVAGGNVTLNNELVVSGTPYKADEAVITPENLTVLLRGLTEDNKVNTMLLIDEHIQRIFAENKHMEITGTTFVDAEKFSVGTQGYDSQHCWAATASNILWLTGYAQKAVNPQTGTYFKSEDEVLSYFSANFTDFPGAPSEGVDWFMKGTSAYSNEYQNMKGIAHWIDPNSGGLLKNAIQSPSMNELWNHSKEPGAKGNPNAISAVLDVCAMGTGVLIKWYENNQISSSAHWMTVVGAIIDEATDVLANKYKGLILADSDSDPAHTEGNLNLKATSAAQKLAEKSKRENAYTAYKLEFVPGLNGNGAWRLVGFAENNNRIAVITHLYSLLDSDKQPEGAGGEPYDGIDLIDKSFLETSSDESCQAQSTTVAHEDKETFVVTDGQNAIVIAKEDIFNALSEADLETSENIAKLLGYMNDNNAAIFARSKGIVSAGNGDSYVAYLKTPATAKLTVTVDGIVLPEDAYEIIVLPNGMIKLRIKNSYLKALSIGAHNLQINAEGTESVIGSVINVFE